MNMNYIIGYNIYIVGYELRLMWDNLLDYSLKVWPVLLAALTTLPYALR